MCEECDRMDPEQREAILRLRKALWGLAFGELMNGMHPADVLSSLALLIAAVVGGGAPEVFNQFEDRKGERGRDAALRALFTFTWKRYEELKAVADGVREQLRTGTYVWDDDAGGAGPIGHAAGTDGPGQGHPEQGRGDRPAEGGTEEGAGGTRRDGGAPAREDPL